MTAATPSPSLCKHCGRTEDAHPWADLNGRRGCSLFVPISFQFEAKGALRAEDTTPQALPLGDDWRVYDKMSPVKARPIHTYFEVATLEGVMRGWPGDYLVEGAAGERWPVRREFFERYYQERGHAAAARIFYPEYPPVVQIRDQRTGELFPWAVDPESLEENGRLSMATLGRVLGLRQELAKRLCATLQKAAATRGPEDMLR